MQSREYLRKPSPVRRRGVSIDVPLLLIVLVLIGIGCFFIYDFTVVSSTVPAKNYYLMRQFMFAALGCCSLLIVSRIDYHFLYQLAVPMLIGIIVLLFCTRAVGSTGFIHWRVPYLFIGKVGIHVAQLTEVVVSLLLAQVMARIDLGERNRLLLVLSALSVCLLPLLSFNMGSTLILLIELCCLLFLTDIQALFTIFASAASVTVALSHALRRLSEYEKAMRNQSFLAWQDPFSDFYGAGFAAAQSIYAVANGGLLGVGIGGGMMRYAVEDVCGEFILPAITEEVGLIGVALILLAYLFLLARMFTIAARAVDRWGFYLASAIIARCAVRFALYLLVRTNFIPQLGGLSLPFISYGGTALVTDCFMIGILLSVRRYQLELKWGVRT